MTEDRFSGNALSSLVFLLAVIAGVSCTYTPKCDTPSDNSIINPVGLALSPDGKYLYVSNANASLRYCSGYISKIDISTIPYNTTIAFLPRKESSMSYLGGLLFSPDGSCLFAANREGNELLVLRTDNSSLSLSVRIPVGEGPFALAYFSPASQILVTNLSSNDVSVVDGIGFKEVTRIPLTRGFNGSRPSGIAVSPTTGPLTHYYAYVTQQLSPYVSILDLSLPCEINPLTPAASSAATFNDTGAASNPTMSAIALQQCSVESEQWAVTFTTGSGEKGYYTVAGSVSGVQRETAIEGVPYTSTSGGVSFMISGGNQPTTPGDSFSFVTYRRTGIMSLLGNSLEGYTKGIAVFPGGTRAAIASRGLRGLVIVDLESNSIVDVISVCDTPEDVAIGPDGNTVYVTCLTAGALYRVDPLRRQIDAVISMERGPSAIVLSADGRRAYVANYRSNSISVVDLQTLAVTERIP